MSGGVPLPPSPGLVWAPPLGWVSEAVAADYVASRAEVGALPEAEREERAAELWHGWTGPRVGPRS